MKKVLVLCWLLALTAFGADYAPETPFIHVMGEAKVSVPPDEVELAFTLPGQADTYAAALKSTDDKFAQLLAFVAAQKIPQDALTSYAVSVRVERDNSDGSSTPPKTTYNASRKVQILLTDLKPFAPVYDEILALESEGDVDVTFKTSKEDGLKKKLLLEAAADAKQKAQELCDSFGMEIDGVHAISEQSFAVIENNFAIYEPQRDEGMEAILTGSGGGGQRQYLGPKAIDCTSDVFVIFTIKAKK